MTSKEVSRRLFMKLASLAGAAIACNLPGRAGKQPIDGPEANFTPDVIVFVTATPEPTREPTPTLSSALDEELPDQPVVVDEQQPSGDGQVQQPQQQPPQDSQPVAPQPTRTPRPEPTRITDVAYVVGFLLVNDAVNYGRSPDGCDSTIIRGSLQDDSGNGVPDIFVRINREGSNIPIAVSTNSNGAYSVDVDDDLSDGKFRVQLTDETGARILSEPVIAQAIPDCDFNLMELNFILRS